MIIKLRVYNHVQEFVRIKKKMPRTKKLYIDDDDESLEHETEVNFDDVLVESDEENQDSDSDEILEENSSSHSSAHEEEEEEENAAFQIVENINNKNDYDQFYKIAEAKLEKRKKQKLLTKNTQLNIPNKIQSIEQEEAETSTNDTVKFVKPLDYAKLKQSQHQKGVIYVSKPFGSKLQNEKEVKGYFERIAKVLRVQTVRDGKSGVPDDKKPVRGFYLEFESKDIAQEVVTQTNATRISQNNTNMLYCKYVPNFSWTQEVTKGDKMQMYKKLLRAEAEKELRQIRMYKQNAQLSEQIKTNKIEKPKKKMRIQQKKAMKKDYDVDTHINLLPIFEKK